MTLINTKSPCHDLGAYMQVLFKNVKQAQFNYKCIMAYKLSLPSSSLSIHSKASVSDNHNKLVIRIVVSKIAKIL